AKLEAARDDAFLSRELATVAVDAPLPQESPADLRRAPIDRTRLGRIGDELGLDGLLRAATRIEG
ncbi:MAG: hypothetical protein AAFP86_05745, partial [Planctomycetota bacterium]